MSIPAINSTGSRSSAAGSAAPTSGAGARLDGASSTAAFPLVACSRKSRVTKASYAEVSASLCLVISSRVLSYSWRSHGCCGLLATILSWSAVMSKS